MNKQIVGVLDIGTTKIVAMIGERINEHTFSVLGYGHVVSKGVKRGNVVNIISTVEGIKQAFEIAKNQAKVDISEVYVGIAGQNIYTIKNNMTIIRDKPNDEITKEELDNIISKQYLIPTNHDEKIIDVIPRYFFIDDHEIYSIENLIGCIGKELRINFNLIIGKSQNIKSIETCIEKANLKLKRMFLEPIASSRAVLHPSEINKGVAMIDIGGGTSDLALYNKGMLIHTAVIPFGGNVITSDIEQCFNLSFEDAEYIKQNFGQAVVLDEEDSKQLVIKNKIEGKESTIIDSKILSNVIQARIEEILGFIEFELSNNAKFNGKQICDVVLTGGGSKLKYLPQLVKYKLSMDARIGYPNIYLTNEINENFNNPQYATAVGLLMLALEDLSKQKENNNILEQVHEDKNISTNKVKNSEQDNNKKSKKSGIFSKFGSIFSLNDSELEK